MRPSLAPQHVLVRFTTQDGQHHNIEATNGGLRGNNSPYIDNMPIFKGSTKAPLIGPRIWVGGKHKDRLALQNRFPI